MRLYAQRFTNRCVVLGDLFFGVARIGISE